jgi:pyruvate dehydrogenase E2 component (dihydrolipoamide acetyltransferase)
MAISVVMPALEMAQETGKLVSWLKKEGDPVVKGDMLLEIETDKAVMEVEATADGVLAGVTGEVGTDIPVGQTIAWIVAPGEQVPASATVTAAAASQKTPQVESTPKRATDPMTASTGQISPKARRLAKEAGIDIGSVRGTGPGGEILMADIQALLDAKNTPEGTSASAKPAATSREPLSAIGKLMAERTTQSWTSVPHFFLQRDVDATGLNSARATHGPAIDQTHSVKLTHTDLLVALVARTMASHPRVNASWIDDGIQLNPGINVAIAMAVEGGVVSAVVSNAAGRSLGEIATQRRDLTERARSSRLRPADLAGATFTISNLGMFDIDSFSAIITPPQAAILAVGRIADRVVAVKGAAVVRPMLSLTLSSDHRVLDGAKAAAFLRDLAEAIQNPEKFLS